MYSSVIDTETASTDELVAVALQIAAELTHREAPESGSECMDLAERLVAVIDRCEAALSPIIGKAHSSDDIRSAGYRSTHAWLRSACGMHGGRARDRVTTARQLPRLNDVTERFSRGDLAYGFTTVITDAVSRLDNDDAATAERLLLHRVDDGCTVRELTAYATRLHDQLQSGSKSEPRGYRRSWIKQSTSADGGTYLKGWLTPEDAALWHAGVGALSKPAGADDPRDHAERTADAVQSILSGGGRNWNATVIIDHSALQSDAARQLDDTQQPTKVAWLSDGTPVSAERARQLALTAGISAMILGPHGLPLYLGRTARLVSPAQRRALEVLYPACAVDDCDVPATYCEMDHVTPWTLGGATNIDQLAPLCGFHNRYKAQHPTRIATHWHNNRWHYTIRHRPLLTTAAPVTVPQAA